MDLLVLAPVEATLPPDARATLHITSYCDAAQLVAALSGPFECAVLWSNGLPDTDLEAVAQAVRQCGRPVVEVHVERWDGVTHSPLSAACRGVISGFGFAGVLEAVALLRESQR